MRKKTGSGVSLNEELAGELHKPVIKKLKNRRVYARFKENISVADLAKIGSLFSNNPNIKYLLCIIDVFTKYAWVKPLKDKKGKTVLMLLILLNESNRKLKELRVDQGKEFYNRFMQKCLDNSDILMYSAHNEGKSVITERCIKTLKAKTCKKMRANNNKSYLAYLNKLVDQYNNTYHQSVGKNILLLVILI